ncbi:MAG TPA: cell division protein FtsK [Chitinophagaceae bacterium]|nr:cell division protein FtsK [Chitinophagaceae bacterium]
MSKKRKTPANTEKIKSKIEKPGGSFTLFKDGRMSKIVGILMIFIAIFLGISFFSYFFTWKEDQDVVMNSASFWQFINQSDQNTLNRGGKLGAWLSHQLIYNGFGLSAWVISLLLFMGGIQIISRQSFYARLKTIAFGILSILLASPLLAYLLPGHQFEFSYGGRFGNLVIGKLLLLAGNIGTACMMIAIGLIVLVLIFNPIFSLPIWHQLRERFNRPAEEKPIPQPIQPEMIIQPEPAYQQTWPEAENKLNVPEQHTPVLEIDPSFFDSIDPIIPPIETAPIPESSVIELEPEIASVKQSTVDELDFEVHTAIEKSVPEVVASGVSVAGDEPYDPSLELRSYKFPTLDLLENRNTEDISVDKAELEQNKNQIINTLKSFGIAIAKISATVGPTVTLYEIVPAEGVRISKIRNLEDDIALSLSALGIRIIAPIPGKGTIGIEVPNMKKQIVNMRTLIASDKFIHNDFSLPIALGKKIDNENYIVDLAKMPHLLMAGATGQGKSVGINTILVSLLYKKHPSQLKFVMVDPKKVELSIYKLIEKHFLAKLPNEDEAIITDTKKVINTLNALCIEMDNRYDLLKEAGVRNIKEYNEKFIKRRLNPNKGHKYLPFIVLVVDEFADLIMTAGKEVEMPIARLAQLARAVGIHLIIATQRPSVNVITGTIKANFPARVAFRVSAKVDSRTILDAGGAEQLIGQGDMLILNGSELVRLQCAFVDTPEVERIVEFIGTQQGYPSAFDLPEYEGSDVSELNLSGGKSLKDVDSMFEQCARLVVTSGSGSTSMLQRRFNLGYNRAGRIMDQLEAAGVVGASIGGKPRELMVHTEAELEEILRNILP